MFKVPAHSMLDKIDDSKLGEKIVDAKTKSDLNICFSVGQDDIDTNMKNSMSHLNLDHLLLQYYS